MVLLRLRSTCLEGTDLALGVGLGGEGVAALLAVRELVCDAVAEAVEAAKAAAKAEKEAAKAAKEAEKLRKEAEKADKAAAKAAKPKKEPVTVVVTEQQVAAAASASASFSHVSTPIVTASTTANAVAAAVEEECEISLTPHKHEDVWYLKTPEGECWVQEADGSRGKWAGVLNGSVLDVSAEEPEFEEE